MEKMEERNNVIVRIKGSNYVTIFQVYQFVSAHDVKHGTLWIVYNPISSVLEYVNNDGEGSLDYQLAKYEIGECDALSFEKNHNGDVIYTIYRDYAIEED